MKNTKKFNYVPKEASILPLKKANGAIIMAECILVGETEKNFDTALIYSDRGKLNKLLLTWNKKTGNMADYSYTELKKDGLLKPVEKFITSLRKEVKQA